MKKLLERVLREVRFYTMVPDEALTATIELTLKAIKDDIPGDLVECGTWKGGASFAMLLAQRYAFGEIKRPVWMYDSFKGMDEPAPEDGTHAKWWRERSQTVPIDPDGQNYCAASLEQVVVALHDLDLLGDAVLRGGWFKDTLFDKRPEKIAVLRVDCDWYDPCQLVYRMMAPLVSVGGPIIIDDYSAWEGCVLATHEYLAQNRLPWRIRSIPNDNGAYMIKEAATW